MSGFLGLGEEDDFVEEKPQKLGERLKRKAEGAPKTFHIDPSALEEASAGAGFSRRTVTPEAAAVAPSYPRGRPALNEATGYWRIWLSHELRKKLTDKARSEDRPIKDLLADMFRIYEEETREK